MDRNELRGLVKDENMEKRGLKRQTPDTPGAVQTIRSVTPIKPNSTTFSKLVPSIPVPENTREDRNRNDWLRSSSERYGNRTSNEEDLERKVLAQKVAEGIAENLGKGKFFSWRQNEDGKRTRDITEPHAFNRVKFTIAAALLGNNGGKQYTVTELNQVPEYIFRQLNNSMSNDPKSYQQLRLLIRDMQQS